MADIATAAQLLWGQWSQGSFFLFLFSHPPLGFSLALAQRRGQQAYGKHIGRAGLGRTEERARGTAWWEGPEAGGWEVGGTMKE